MLIKRIAIAAFAVLSLSLIADAMSTSPASAAPAGALTQGKEASMESSGPIELVHAHGMGGHSSFHQGFAHHHFFRHRHRQFFVGPFLYDGYPGGSCYWNCRQYHGPAFCRAYAANYCY